LAEQIPEAIRARTEHHSALLTLTEEQRGELDEAFGRYSGNALWSTRLALEWMFKEAVRRGWLSGPA